MIEDKYIITENQLCKLTHGIDDTLECRELIVKIRANIIFPKATKEDQKLGWKHDYKYLLRLTTLQQEHFENVFILGMEEIDGLLTAMEKIVSE
jgi:hypothetical protein